MAEPVYIGRAVFVFSTDDHIYDDKILLCPVSGVAVLRYQGQHRFRRSDALIANPVNNIHFFYRSRLRQPFMYLGKVETARIIQERSADSPLLVEYVIHQHVQMEDVSNPFRHAIGQLIRPTENTEAPRSRFDYRFRNGVFRSFHATPCSGGRQGIQLVTIRL